MEGDEKEEEFEQLEIHDILVRVGLAFLGVEVVWLEQWILDQTERQLQIPTRQI